VNIHLKIRHQTNLSEQEEQQSITDSKAGKSA
jgi:hypothetical protein